MGKKLRFWLESTPWIYDLDTDQDLTKVQLPPIKKTITDGRV